MRLVVTDTQMHAATVELRRVELHNASLRAQLARVDWLAAKAADAWKELDAINIGGHECGTADRYCAACELAAALDEIESYFVSTGRP